MAINIIEKFYYGETTLDNYITSKTYLQKSFYSVTFSEMTTTAKPVIQIGSSIEIDGDLYYFDANEPISVTPSTGVCYVKVYVSGSNAIAEMTNTSPAFNFLKNGWYGTGGSAAHRYIMKLYYDGTNFQIVTVPTVNSRVLVKVAFNGGVGPTALTGSVNVSGIVRSAQGIFVVSFTANIGTDYVAQVSCFHAADDRIVQLSTKATGSCTIHVRDTGSTDQDCDQIFLTIM